MIVEFKKLEGKVLKKITVDGEDTIYFITEDDSVFRMHGWPACCEVIEIEEIVGDLQDLLETPILKAYESSNEGENIEKRTGTWTFYNLSTIKGSVTIRWWGESNGNYSENACFEEIIIEAEKKYILKKLEF